MTRIKHLLIGRNPVRTLVRTVFVAVASLLLFGLAARPVKVTGISMEPTLRDGTFHFINLLAYLQSDPKRGDMVAIEMAGHRAFYMKRVLGLPGETVAFDNGKLVINGRVMAEPYVNYQGQWNMETARVPDGQYFVAGDNRATDFAAHTLGFVKRDKMKGTLLK